MTIMLKITMRHCFFTGVFLLSLVMTPSAASRLREVGGLDEEDTRSSSINSGVTVAREIQKIPGSFQLRFGPGNCDSEDAFGDNDCHFEWNQDVTGAILLVIDEPIEEGDTMEGHVKVRKSQW